MWAQDTWLNQRGRIVRHDLQTQSLPTIRAEEMNSRQNSTQNARVRNSEPAIPLPAQPPNSAEILPLKHTWIRIPNWICITAVFAMLNRRDPIERSNEYTKLQSRAWTVSARRCFLTSLDYQVYVELLRLLSYVDHIDVTLSSLARALGTNTSRRRKQIKNSMRRLGWTANFKIDVPVRRKGIKHRAGPLLKIDPIKNGYRVQMPTNMIEYYEEKNSGLLSYEIHKSLSSPLAQALYRYVVGQPRGWVHKVKIADLRTYLGYQKVELSKPRDYTATLLKALKELKAHKVLSNISIKEHEVVWKYM